MKKRIISFMMILIMLVGLLPISGTVGTVLAEGGMPFTDVEEGRWFYDEVEYVYYLGLMEGKTDTEFEPLTNMTRAELVTLLYRLAGATETELGATLTFTDTNPTAWYADYVGWAVKEGLVSGYPEDNTFKPNNPVNRQEIAKLFVEFIEYMYISCDRQAPLAESFKDADSAQNWAKTYIEAMRETGLISGDTAGNYNPKSFASRAEIATIVQRYAMSFGDDMYSALVAFEADYTCDAHKVIEMTLSGGGEWNRDGLNKTILSAIGLPASIYMIEFVEEGIIELADKASAMSGESIVKEITFRILNKDTGMYTKEFTKTYDFRKFNDYGGLNVCLNSKFSVAISTASAARLSSKLPLVDGKLEFILGNEVEAEDIGTVFTEALGYPYGPIQIRFGSNKTEHEAKMEELFGAESDYAKLSYGQSLEKDLTFRLYSPKLGGSSSEIMSGELTFKFKFTKNELVAAYEKLPDFDFSANVEINGSPAEKYLNEVIADSLREQGYELDSIDIGEEGVAYVNALYNDLAAGERIHMYVIADAVVDGKSHLAVFTLGLSKAPNPVPQKFYFVKDGKAVSTIIVPGGGVGVSMDYVSGASASKKMLKIVEAFQEKILELSNTLVPFVGDDNADQFGAKFLIGNTKYIDYPLMGEATSDDCVLAGDEFEVQVIAHTAGGVYDALEIVSENLVAEGNDVYFDLSILGIHDRELGEYNHIFTEFTNSFYGPIYNGPGNDHRPSSSDPDDFWAIEQIAEFGADVMPMWGAPKGEAADAFFAKCLELGVNVRLSVFPGYYEVFNTSTRERIMSPEEVEQKVKENLEIYAKYEAITEWGLVDEPPVEEHQYFGELKALVQKYDPLKRPCYTNFGCIPDEDFYDSASDVIVPSEYRYDDYPFHYDKDLNSRMMDYDFYANMEINRDYAVDDRVSASIILAAMKVGGANDPDPNDPNFDSLWDNADGFANYPRAEITGEFMGWQTSLITAYGYKCWESYVYYPVHKYAMLNSDYTPNWRWYLAQDANFRLKELGNLLFDYEVDAVFHIANEDGTYSNGTIPYYGYRNLGEITGCDAIISFLEDDIIILTDKRCEFDQTEHEVSLENIDKNDEWYNLETSQWEPLSTCEYFEETENGGTFTLNVKDTQVFLDNEQVIDVSMQYVIRRK